MASKNKVKSMLHFSSSSSDEECVITKTTPLKPKSVVQRKTSTSKPPVTKKAGSELAGIFNIYTRQIGNFANGRKNRDQILAITTQQECETLSSEDDILEKLTSKIKPTTKANSKRNKVKVSPKRLRMPNKTLDQPVVVNVNEVVDNFIDTESLQDDMPRRLRSSTKRRKRSESSQDEIDSPVLKRKSSGKAFAKTINTLDENLKFIESNESLNDSVSDEELEEEITVRIQCPTGIKKFRMKLNQEFSTIQEALAMELEIAISEIGIYFGSDVIHPTDTPGSRSIRPSEILYCFSGSTLNPLSETNGCPAINVNEIELKVQSSLHNKKKIAFKCDKTKPLRLLAEEFASQNNIDVSKVILKFDGDLIDLEESPDNLEIENGDCIDILVR